MAKDNNDSTIQDKLNIALAALGVLATAIEVFNKLADSYRKNGIDKTVDSWFTKEEPKKNKRRRNRNRNKHKITNQTNNAKVLTNKTITKITKDTK